MKKHDFEARREALLKDIREVMDDVEELYRDGVEAGSEEGGKARAKLEEKLAAAKERLSRFEERPAYVCAIMPSVRVRNTSSLKRRPRSVLKKAKSVLPNLKLMRASV